MRHIILAAAVASVVVLTCPPSAQAQGNMPVGSSSQLGHISHQDNATHRAAEACNRGSREMKKARDAKDPAEQKAHYGKAREQFQKSLGLEQNFDALLGLGQANLALADPQGARGSCLEALALKPDSAEAKACADQATAALSPPAPVVTPPPAAATPPPGPAR